jgi:hypothetical protein
MLAARKDAPQGQQGAKLFVRICEKLATLITLIEIFKTSSALMQSLNSNRGLVVILRAPP